MAVNTLGLYAKIPVTIAAGQSVSAPVVIGEAAIVAIEIPNPNAWVTAQLTFLAATDIGAIGTATPGNPDPTQANYNNVIDKNGAAYQINVSTTGALSSGVGNGCYITLSGGTSAAPIVGSSFIDGIKYLKIRSGTSATPVVQTNAQTINVIVKALY